MYKVELSFDMSRLNDEDAAALCRQTDRIFAKEDLSCQDCGHGRRIYLDKGRKQDYGRFWAAIFALKDTSEIVEHMEECFWYNGADKANLKSDFLRS